uniref:uncharacterized protein LOC122583733 n=1 Tax=Erigeron canadensis TaxID=72917 RepID=UPI001CB9481D|nr:uncharacterized protein LOC122583733 [Erigeron canadensis]
MDMTEEKRFEPKDAMPWVGLYVAMASLVYTLAMAADVFQGFRKLKLWFPNRFFTLNTASITLIAIAMKLLVDLNVDLESIDDGDVDAKLTSIFFLVTMLANFLPSLGLMDDRELLLNMVAWGILIGNIWIQIIIGGLFRKRVSFLVMIPLLWVFSVALTVPPSRRTLELKYKELQRSEFNQQEINFSYKDLRNNVKKYWMMAETGNPQFVIACSQVSSAFGVICVLLMLLALLLLFVKVVFFDKSLYDTSDYKWSLKVIIIVDLLGTVVGSIAPIFRCLTSFSYFSLSIKWSMNHLNVFKIEKHWIHMLQEWKHSHVSSHIPGRGCKKVFLFFRNMLLNFCIALQVIVVVMCKTICLIPTILLITLSCCWYICKSVLKMSKKEPNVSGMDGKSEIEEYRKYVIQIEDDAKLSERVIKNTFNSITQLLHVSEKKRPRNLMTLLQKSTGFIGVVEFDSEQVPSSEKFQNSWSLVTLTLTAIVIALPNIAKDHVKGLLEGMKEGLQIVRVVEESINSSDELEKVMRRTSRRVGTDIEVYRRWLGVNLRKKAREGKTSKEILQLLRNKAEKTVEEFESPKNFILDPSFHKFIAAKSMSRITQTLLHRYNNQENWPTDNEVFEQVSTIIADILYACFTNLPRVITMKCHHDAIEKRQDSIRTAAQVLGKSKEILEILESRQLPNLDMDSMAYLDKWHALPKSQMPKGCASASSNESLSVTIM